MRSFVPVMLFAYSAAMAQPRGPASPVVTKRVEPEYTAEARSAGLEGLVTVYLEVGEQGEPENVAALQSLGLGLDEKAVEAVKQWRFQAPLPSSPRLAEAVNVPFRLDSNGWRIRQTAYAVVREDQHRWEPVVAPVLMTYTRPSAEACIAGEAPVRVEMNVGKDGRPSGVFVADDRGAMGKAVADAASSWTFQHALGSGEPRAATASFLLECGPRSTGHIEPSGLMVGRGVAPPSLISKVEPEYSEDARKVKLQGTVRIHLEIDPDGIPTHFRVSPLLGHGLDFTAMDAVRRWRFKPGTKDGRPVSVVATLEVNFRLL